MNYLNYFLLLALMLLTTGVGAQDTIPTRPVTDLSQLEGRYKVIAIHDTVYATLEWICLMNPRLGAYYFRDKGCYISIQKTRSKRLSFSLWEGEKKWAASHMKGRLKDGKAYVRGTKIGFFSLLVNALWTHRAEMALSESGDLVVSNANLGGLAFLVVMPFTGATDQPKTLVFERVREGG